MKTCYPKPHAYIVTPLPPPPDEELGVCRRCDFARLFRTEKRSWRGKTRLNRKEAGTVG